MRSPGSLVWTNLVASRHESLRFRLASATSARINGAWWPKPQAREGPGLKPLEPGPKPLVEHADQGAHARLSSRIGHVCKNNAVLVLHSPGNMAFCADWFPTQQLKIAKLLSPGSLAWTNRVALIGLVPAAENPQGLGFRLLRFLRLWIGGLSRRLLSPAWPSWSSADARLAKLCL